MLIIQLSLADNYITRGPAVGEIYFKGTTSTSMGIYHSLNFGKTAICKDSIIANDAFSIVADKTSGVVYYVTMEEGLYISYDFGQQGSWVFRNYSIKPLLNSGRNEGEIYSSCSKHSGDFGYNFINHNLFGYFGNRIDVEVDNVNSNLGYILVGSYTIPDTLYLLVSYDNFDNLEIFNSFKINESNIIYISSGTEEGELYLFNRSLSELYFSNNFANTFNQIEYYNFYNNCALTGGRQSGELYIVMYFINMLWQNAHTYIFHSTDYGATFEVFHPSAKGQEPVLANFSTTTKEGNQPLTVEFCNFSIGNIQEYEWDFDNDGIIDSYEESPSWTYTEPGTYSVSLTITAGTPDSTNTFVKEDYINVLPGNSLSIELNTGYQFISSNRSPENPNLLEVLGNNLNDNLGFVRNSQGETLLNIGGNWVNNIGDWVSTEGYLFKMNNEDILIIDGETVNPQTPISLITGYQFVSYLPNETLNALETFSSILNDDLDFIRNSYGETIRKIGTNWVNGIGDCDAGEGFLVKMNGEGVLVYP
ncbi:MAG: PKD domain-containing protein [Bacteroidales bacterium]|nr:PKD domain-containing protein [Bacteroidales bacterium]